ncbi:hypothetical protein [Pedobacter nutrimenti]|uniref:Per1-like protein n=1 Tax=Pedobacter nutrimenti TaxID=1241337 RepID=A0A318UHW6_9SPHI|nr:hypothetical protein [Pedobacter nutrimenti]PYF74648.1 Per1-like protein [Pedobacter nutrimenti]
MFKQNKQKPWRVSNTDMYIELGTVVLVILLVFLFALGICWVNHSPKMQNVWSGFPLGITGIASAFCEKTKLSNPVRQPVNSFSSVVYLIVAIIILKDRQFYSNTSSNVAIRLYQLLFGVILLYIFVTSFFYHASLIRLARKLDYSGVFAFSLFPILYFSHRWRLVYKSKKRPNKKIRLYDHILLVFLSICVLLSLFIPHGLENKIVFLIILVLFILAFAAEKLSVANTNRMYLMKSGFSVFMALFWFEFDKYKPLCNPDSYFQPHSLWNLFIGIAAFHFYLYIRSEKEPITYSINLI